MVTGSKSAGSGSIRITHSYRNCPGNKTKRIGARYRPIPSSVPIHAGFSALLCRIGTLSIKRYLVDRPLRGWVSRFWASKAQREMTLGQRLYEKGFPTPEPLAGIGIMEGLAFGWIVSGNGMYR